MCTLVLHSHDELISHSVMHSGSRHQPDHVPVGQRHAHQRHQQGDEQVLFLAGDVPNEHHQCQRLEQQNHPQHRQRKDFYHLAERAGEEQAQD
jgi:hypothetical protein